MSANPLTPPPIIPTPEPRRSRKTKAATSLIAQGEPMLWLTGGALVICVIMIVCLLGLVLWQGIGTFWPQRVVSVTTSDGKIHAGEVVRIETFRPQEQAFAQLPADKIDAAKKQVADQGGIARRRLIRTGNFDISGEHFTWVSDFAVVSEAAPEWIIVAERLTWGRFYGTPSQLLVDDKPVASEPGTVWAEFLKLHEAAHNRWARAKSLETNELGRLNHSEETARLAVRQAELSFGTGSPEHAAARAAFDANKKLLDEESLKVRAQVDALRKENDRYRLVMVTADGTAKPLALAEVTRAYPANQLSVFARLGIYFSRWWEYLSQEPREANSEGGVFPAIFGTVMMTLIMSLIVVPFGVLAALYLREYAKPGMIVTIVRIAVNNLAGVPSIVFGVFGLGFFCYGIGRWIDAGPATPWPPAAWFLMVGALVVTGIAALGIQCYAWTHPSSARSRGVQRLAIVGGVLWVVSTAAAVTVLATSPYFHGFNAARLPSPTYGTGGILWASLTLSLLTLPVVIVATEEALASVPSSMREGSYGCGASKWQTIHRIVLPRAMPGIMTGMILAMARGAGEVAPLMLVGAVKLAPELPFDTNAPFVHPERSFMHLGFHIYDLGFQSQNSEAAKPMVFTTTLLLIVLIATLNVFAVWLRTRLRRRFVSAQF
jgi:ABC-type phosphate transport system permease subunit